MTRTVHGILYSTAKTIVTDEGIKHEYGELIIANRDPAKAEKLAKKRVSPDTAIFNPVAVTRKYLMPDELFFKYATVVPMDTEDDEESIED